jgi:hypothetical protein
MVITSYFKAQYFLRNAEENHENLSYLNADLHYAVSAICQYFTSDHTMLMLITWLVDVQYITDIFHVQICICSFYI